MAEERERIRRQLALETKRRQRLFEQKAKEREVAEEELVRWHAFFHFLTFSRARTCLGWILIPLQA